MNTLSATRAPKTLDFFTVNTEGKGTYTAQGREYTYIILNFKIRAKDGREVELRFFADAVNGVAQPAILGIGAALKEAHKRFHDADQLKKALEGDENGDQKIHISYAANVQTENETTNAQKIKYHLFEVEPFHQGFRPLFKAKERTCVELNDDEIRYLKNVSDKIEKTIGAIHKNEAAEPGAALEQLPHGIRLRVEEDTQQSNAKIEPEENRDLDQEEALGRVIN